MNNQIKKKMGTDVLHLPPPHSHSLLRKSKAYHRESIKLKQD